MYASQAQEWGGPRRHHHHHHHHQGGHRRNLEDFITLMRGGPWGDPRDFKAMFFGPGGGPGGPGGRGGRGRGRARRGDVRAAMLILLEGEPQNGYQLIQEIERRTEGLWKPSPGSVYPALQQLEDEGLVAPNEGAGRRAFELTDQGREYVAANREELGDPFASVRGGMDEGVMDLRGLMFQVGAAAMQVAAAGHTEEARRILTDTRRALYSILAEDPGDRGEA
jgi:DNA-binding PadR family transcriptional regulator